MSFLKSLNNPIYEVKVVSRNFSVFTPLLPCVTCGKVEARSIAEPIHNIIRKKNVDIRVSEAECVKINPQNKKIYCRATIDSHSKGQEEFTVDYDYLIIAVGAQVNTFNTPGVMENCHFLKEIGNAQKIHENVIESFEKACLLSFSDKERKKILHFVIVGSGPAGVEFAAELHDFVKEDVVQLYPKVKDLVKITLLEATYHILNMFEKRITNVAENKFGREGIDVKFGSMITGISENEISTKIRDNCKTTFTPYGMVLWSTSIELCPLIKEFMRQIGQGNRRALAIDEWLRVEKIDNVYALGNYATINQRKVMEEALSEVNSQMKNLPATAQVAKQQVVHIVFVKEILKRGVSYEDDGKGQKGEPIIYFAWKMIVEGAEDGQGAVENGREWILEHDNAIVIISWRKIWLSVLRAYEWSENNPLPPEVWLCPCFLPFHPGKMWCHCRMVYSTINFFAPMSRYRGGVVGASREFKDMVKALYGAGIEEILDVVYNHINEADDKHPYTTSFLGIDNKVYYMVDLNNKAQLLNFFGCGNTLNCNHLVVIELILDSLRHWSVEYHVDGFRGDRYCGHSVLNKFKRAWDMFGPITGKRKSSSNP